MYQKPYTKRRKLQPSITHPKTRTATRQRKIAVGKTDDDRRKSDDDPEKPPDEDFTVVSGYFGCINNIRHKGPAPGPLSARSRNSASNRRSLII